MLHMQPLEELIVTLVMVRALIKSEKKEGLTAGELVGILEEEVDKIMEDTMEGDLENDRLA